MALAPTAAFRRAVRRTRLPKTVLAGALGWHRNTLGNYLTWQRPPKAACRRLAAWLDAFARELQAEAGRLREAASPHVAQDADGR